MVEQDKQCLGGLAVQNSEKGVGKVRKRRSQSDKAGINRWTQQLVLRCLVKLEALETEARWMRHKMDRLGEADYPREDVERFSVMDEVDREIMQRLLEAGVDGLLPAVVAVDLNKRFGYTLHYYDVSRRLVRLNNRLQTETGKVLFEKRGAKKWALSKFGFDVYGATEEELSGVTPVGGSEEAEV